MITRNCECIKNNITKNTNTLVYLRLLQTKLIISNVPNKRKEVNKITHCKKRTSLYNPDTFRNILLALKGFIQATFREDFGPREIYVGRQFYAVAEG